MTEFEKLKAGLEYDLTDPEIEGRKLHAVKLCEALNSISVLDAEGRRQAIRDLFGDCGENPEVLPGFNCDCGSNIHAGDNFLANYNVTILDVAPVYFGDNVMIGPNVLIATVNHPLSPSGRRRHLATATPVRIGDDVWIGGNATIVPGVTIGSNVVIAAGAVVTGDVPDNCLFGGVPARKLRDIPDDVPPESRRRSR